MSTPLDPMRQLAASGALGGIQPTPPPPAVSESTGPSFDDVLKRFVNQVDEAQKGFDKAIEAVERGDTDNLHQLMIAQNQAQVTLKMAAEVRNKVVEAYREVMRTQF